MMLGHYRLFWDFGFAWTSICFFFFEEDVIGVWDGF
jgi:hypothetical protein